MKESLKLILHMKDTEFAAQKPYKWIDYAAHLGFATMAKLSKRIKSIQNPIYTVPGKHLKKRSSKQTSPLIEVTPVPVKGTYHRSVHILVHISIVNTASFFSISIVCCMPSRIENMD